MMSFVLLFAWQVNLGPLPPFPTMASVSVCTDGSVLSAESGTALMRIDPDGILRSTDFRTGNSRVVCLTDGYAELLANKVIVRRWSGRVAEYSIPSPARNGIQLPGGDLLLLTAAGPTLFDQRTGGTHSIESWGDYSDQEAFLAVNAESVAIVYAKSGLVEVRDLQTFHPRTQLVPAATRDIAFGTAYLPDGRLVIQTRTELAFSDNKKLNLSRRGYGLLHGATPDGCLIFSAFHSDTGKVLRKYCLPQ